MARNALITDLSGSEADYVLYIKNNVEAGPMNDPNNDCFDLRYIDLSNPSAENEVEQECRSPGSTLPRAWMSTSLAGFAESWR
jgi:hypothetical protein